MGRLSYTEAQIDNGIGRALTELAEKPATSVAGDLASLKADGNLEDSGILATDVALKFEVQNVQDEVENITPKRTASNDPDNSSFAVVCDTAIEGAAKPTLYGKSVAINQLQYNGNFASADGWNGGTVAAGWIETTAGAATYAMIYNSNTVPEIVASHKYYACGTIKAVSGLASGSTTIVLRIGGTDSTTEAIYAANITIADGSGRQLEGIFSPKAASVGTNKRANWGVYNSANAVDAKWTNLNIIDLTAIFTAAELTAIGTSVPNLKTAWLKKFGYPLPQYIDYSAGKIVSNNATYQMRGRNLWDEVWEVGSIDTSTGANTPNNNRIRSKNYIPVPPNATLYFKASKNLVVMAYDENKQFITNFFNNKNTTFDLSSGQYVKMTEYIRFYTDDTSYANDICINLSDASFNGQYEAYYNGGSVTADSLNGIGTAQDTQDAEGQIVRRIGSVGMGTLAWAGSGGAWYSGAIADAKLEAQWATNLLCPAYPTVEGSTADKVIRGISNAGRIYINDSAYADAAAFKVAMNGVILYYEIATPTNSTTSAADLTTQAGYNSLDPVAGDVQSADAECEYGVDIVAYVDSKVADLTALISSI